MKFTAGPAISSASGSIGGTTFSRNRFGAYTRRRSNPVDPNTNRQQAVKTNFGLLSTQWSLVLTPAEREDWDQYGANVPRVDSLGQTHFLSGVQWFIGLNTIRMQAGLGVQTAAPTTFNRGQMPALVSIYGPSDSISSPVEGSYLNLQDGSPVLNLQFDQPVSSDVDLTIALGRPQNPTVNFYKAPWRYWRTPQGDDIAQFSLSAGVLDPLPYNYSEGQAVFVRLRLVYPDGRYTPPSDYKLRVADISE